MPVCRVCQDARTKFDLENGRTVVGTTKKGEYKRHTASTRACQHPAEPRPGLS